MPRPSDDSPATAPVATAIAAATLVGAWVVLTWPWLSGSVTVPWDAKAQFQPQVQFLARALAAGDSPFWTPYVFSGHPQVADPQALIFSPPYFLLALVNPAPSLWALDMTAYAAILVAGFAILVYARDQEWHPAGGLVAAIAFGFGAAMAWRIQHTGQVLSLVYLVITLAALSRALDRAEAGRPGGAAYGAFAGAVAACMVLGRDQVALIGVYVLVGFVLWRLAGPVRLAPAPLRAALRFLPVLVAGGAVGLLLIALPVAMTALVAEASNRPSIDLTGAGRGSLHPALLVTLAVPDLFGGAGHMADYWGPPSFAWTGTDLYIAQNMGVLYFGAVPLLLVTYGFVSGALITGTITFLTTAFALCLLYGLGWYTPLFPAAHALLPGVDFFRRPADAVFLIGGIGALLAGYVLHRLASGTLPVRTGAVAITAGVTLATLLAAAAMAIAFGRLAQAAPALLMSAAALLIAGLVMGAAVWLMPIRPHLAMLMLAAAVTADLAIFNGPNTSNALPPAHYEVLEPDSRNETMQYLKQRTALTNSATRRDRVELVGLGFHWPNASLTHGLENTLGYNPIRLADYVAATGAPDSAGLPENRTFSPLMPSYRSAMADLLGLRYIASGVAIEEIDRALRPGDLRLVRRTADGFIYENPRALPRVVYATKARAIDFAGAVASGRLPDVDFTDTVLLDAASNPPLPSAGTEPPSPATGAARLVRYGNTHVVVDVEGPGGYLVLHDIWQPWWTAERDGGEVPILKGNILFRAVAVPSGRHTVTFTFAPVAGTIRMLIARLTSEQPPASAAHGHRP
ncbi:MAG: hypothetical protein NW205_07400 [Hyphomicrobiaceae bacterium]|nr:hypothetical protein [Hyphomicrobiaceae bacterium]